jgi:hypothetical protein
VEVLKEDFELAEWEPPEADNDFLGSIGRELEIEANKGKPSTTGSML